MSFSNEKIASLLANHQLPTDSEAVQRLRDDLEIAAEMFELPVVEPLKTRDAKSLITSITRVLTLSVSAGIATEDDIAALRRVRRRALIDLSAIHEPGPKTPDWLWPCCINFWDTWGALTDRPAGLHTRGDLSPALEFLVACCALIDPRVNASAILRAKKRFEKGSQGDDPDSYEAYEAWWSEIAQKERDLEP